MSKKTTIPLLYLDHHWGCQRQTWFKPVTSAEESSCQMRVKTEPTEDNESQNDTFYEKSISDNIEELLKEPSLDSLLANVEHVLHL